MDRPPISNKTPKVTKYSSTKYSSLYPPQSRWQRLQSWRVGIALCAMTSGLTLFVNLALTIWVSTKGFEGGIATVQKGDCNMTKKLDLWLHLGINLLSTLLLGASNYTMQCLSAVTGDEIDKAHQQRISLDIGTLSLRNLRRISWRRVILWWLLALSSIPLHFMYNSAVFSTLSTHPYTAAVVSHDFLTGASFDQSWTANGFSTYKVDAQRLTALRDNQSELQNLSNDECLKAYHHELLPDRLDVLAISSALNTNTSLLGYFPDNVGYGGHSSSMSLEPGAPVSYAWTCIQAIPESGSYDLQYRCASPVHWTVLDFPIEYCLSQSAESSCKLQFSLVIMVIVISCNFSKTFCMILTIWKPSSVPLLTLGDAIASFLDQPDPNTVNNCLAGKHRFRKVKYACFNTLPSWNSVVSGYGQISNAANDALIDRNQVRKAGWDKEIRTSISEQHRWYQTTSLKRWLLCISLCTFTLVIVGILLKQGLDNVHLEDTRMSHLWSLGYGGVNPQTIISLYGSFWGTLIPVILLANLPQVILSFLYLTYNSLFTSMLLAEEWSGFAHQRKTLRVTCPVGKQRSTYWLQLPYIYGIPLLVMSGILHWLVSQSIFLVRVAVEDNFVGHGWREEIVSKCGYSPIAIITVIPLGVLLLLVLVVNGFRKCKEGMPLAGSCSAAISAACHRPKGDLDAAVLPVLWGAVSIEGRIGHCCFTSFDVSTPVKGKPYADRDAMASIDSSVATRADSAQAGSGLRSKT
ncbi:hypothetical protein MMC29_006356 [Sticta canariensis]|nr:hypothetical protein [Sticta canariensis]